MITDNEVVHAADTLTAWIGSVSTETRKLSTQVASLLAENLAVKSKTNKAALLGLDGIAREFLEQNSFAVGAGTFFAADFAEAGGRALEWWYRKNDGTTARLDADRTPGSNRYYDYEKLPFFSIAASTGEQTVWGPYIDYLGFEEYILTFTAPVCLRGKFIGVSGCDIRIKDLEPLIMPNLRAIPADAALVNASNRVILGNSGTYLVGERIRPGAYPEHRIALDIPHLGLSLVYTA